MYESHFGITGPPFQLSPDPSFYFDSKGHHRALAEIHRGLADKAGIVVVSGEIGAGKTTLVRTLLEEMDASRFAIGQVLSTQLDTDELLRAILIAFGVTPQDDTAVQGAAAAHRQFAALAKDGWRPVLIIDEAQNLHPDAFSLLVELDRDGAQGRSSLKLFLVGQPELRDLVASDALRSLRERVRVSCHLGPLDAAETGDYIQHRLRKVGWSGLPRFEEGAFAEIHRWTQGIPRRVNLLCNRLMLSRFLTGQVEIDAATVETTARDLRAEIGDAGPEPLPVRQGGAIETFKLIDMEAEPTDAAPSVPKKAEARLPAAAVAPIAPVTPAAPTPAPPAPLARTATPAPAKADERARDDDDDDDTEAKPSTPILKRDRRRPGEAAPQLPPMALQGDGSGPLLCVVGGQADHLKAAALMTALAARTDVPAVMLVRAAASDAVERNSELFAGIERGRLINLGLGAGTEVGRATELMKRFEFVVDHCEPAAVIVFDASEVALYGGLVARSKSVAVVHIGAGLRTPETAAAVNVPRRLTDNLADLLYTSEAGAAERLVREGVPTQRIHFAGNLLVDALQTAMRSALDKPTADDELAVARPLLSDAHGYGVVAIDALANVVNRQTLSELVTILRQVSRDLPLIWPMHQRTHDQLVKLRLDAFIAGERIACIPTLRYATFSGLLASATCVLSDSWNVQEEATALGITCLTLGVEPAHPIGIGVGTSIAVGKNKTLATRAVWECIFNGGRRGHVPELWDGKTAERIAEHLAGWLVAQRGRRV